MVYSPSELSFRGDLKRFHDCDTKAMQIVAKAQQAFEAQEIANLAQQTKPKDMEIPTKKASIITPPLTRYHQDQPGYR
jgi:hypothetical protein